MDEDSGSAKIREAVVAGLFYPEEADALRKEVRRLLYDSDSQSRKGAQAIISPHAGLSYAGRLNALAWKAALGREVRRILILSPYHRAAETAIYLPEAEYFTTPLGAIPVDRALVEECRDCGTLFLESDIPHLEEHGIELQLPFAQLLFPDARIVPILLGGTSQGIVKAMSRALDIIAGSLGSDSLVVISSDFAASCDPEESRKAADRQIALVEAGDARSLIDELGKGRASFCGAACVASYLLSSLNAPACLLGRTDSAKLRENEEELVVHYAAIAFGGSELS